MRWFVEKIIRKQCLLPGRWKPKKNVEEWMVNYHPDPGYSNFLKDEWLKKLKDSKK